MHTLSSRLLISHLLVAVVALGLVGVLSSLLFRHYYVAQTKEALAEAGEDLAATIGRVMGEPDGKEKVALLTRAASRSLGGRVCVFDAKHTDLLASSDLKGHAGVAAGLACDAGVAARIDHTQVLCYPGPVITVAAPIWEPGTADRIGVVLLRRPLREVESTLRMASILVGVSGVVAAILAFLLSAAAARAIARPLSDMARTASELAEGDFSVRVERKGPLELRTLAAGFNNMARELATTFQELSSERERLAGVLAGMDEGVVSVDPEGRVLVANDAARRLLTDDGRALVGSDLADLLPDPQARQSLKSLLSGEEDRFRRIIEDGGRSLRLHASGDRAQGGAILVIADVTEAERLERLRRDFVANASHELRAPLTSIRGFLGAIADGTASTEQEKQRCLRIAGEQANVMRRLVDQLLDLSRLQAGVVLFEPEELDITDLARGAVEALSPQAAKRRVSQRVQAEEIPLLHADGDRIMQVLVNLIDNAIRFAPAGSEVVVSAALDSSPDPVGNGPRVTVSVRDHGPGIPEEDLPLIWDRFHKADKSRRRTDGGAGLGLAIAREIVTAHGGEVHAANAPAGGAVLSFSLPIDRP